MAGWLYLQRKGTEVGEDVRMAMERTGKIQATESK